MTRDSKPEKRPSTGHDELVQGITAYERHEPAVALEAFKACVAIASERRDQALHDRAFSNLVSVQLELELAVDRDSLTELRRVLLRCNDPNTACLAAYNIARIYDLDKDKKKAMFYGQLALDHSNKPAARGWQGACLNLLGNLRLSDSQFEEACTQFERALRYADSLSEVQRAFIVDNLGYCRFVQGRPEEGFELAFNSLRTFIHAGTCDFELYPRLTLCYGYLDVKKYRSALRQGLRALEAAVRIGDVTAHKNAMFLVGEAYNGLGDQNAAWDTFEELQQRYFPDSPHIPTLLMSIDVRSLVNLKA
jgi:tetratricopeptide (TPR) repeat protein